MNNTSPRPAFTGQKLEHAAAYGLLQRARTGHIGCYNPSGDHSYIVPVNFVLSGDAIYFFAAPGRKTSYMRTHPRGVCFQVDEIGPDSWISVIAYGHYGEVKDMAERARATAGMVAKYGTELLEPALEQVGGNPLEAARFFQETVLGYIFIERISGRSG